MIRWHQITPLSWKRIAAAIVLIAIASALRIWPLQALESKVAWLTFYPTVMIAAIYGGLGGGLIATGLACCTVLFLWRWLVAAPFIAQSADWLGLYVFIMTGTMISIVAESMRKANRQSAAAQEKAQAANEAKSVFLANMSHELRTPLNAILGYSQLMQRDVLLSPESRSYLETINRSGEHLLSLINDVLDIAKIESQKAVLNIVVFDSHELIMDIRDMLKIKADVKGLSFDFEGVYNVPRYLEGDATKFKMVLINLIGNSIKFTESGGINVQFRVQSAAENTWVVTVEVSDTGLGIAQSDMDKLFKFFSQTESGRTSKSGSGLGLAISQAYVRMMGGEITVSSQEGKGSTFSFSVQMQAGKLQQTGSMMDRRQVLGLKPGQHEPCILVAEDIDENRRLLVKLLGIVSKNVYEAVNGKEAVELFETHQPDFIWMDIRMPVMDGLEATRQIKASKQGNAVKIVALSAHVFADEKDAIFRAGCNDFLTKPFRENDFFRIMAELLKLEYLYADEPLDAVQSADVFETPLPNFDYLSEQTIQSLHEALLSLDTEKITDVIDRIRGEDISLAVYLKKLADDMNYTALLKFTESRKANAKQ
jgi:signal transduction histidine kinase/CheY-like chemotaxis protein